MTTVLRSILPISKKILLMKKIKRKITPMSNLKKRNSRRKMTKKTAWKMTTRSNKITKISNLKKSRIRNPKKSRIRNLKKQTTKKKMIPMKRNLPKT